MKVGGVVYTAVGDGDGIRVRNVRTLLCAVVTVDFDGKWRHAEDIALENSFVPANVDIAYDVFYKRNAFLDAEMKLRYQPDVYLFDDYISINGVDGVASSLFDVCGKPIISVVSGLDDRFDGMEVLDSHMERFGKFNACIVHGYDTLGYCAYKGKSKRPLYVFVGDRRVGIVQAMNIVDMATVKNFDMPLPVYLAHRALEVELSSMV